MAFGFKAAGRTSVTRQRLYRVVQGALHLRMELLVFEFFPGNPLGRRDQRGLLFEVVGIACTRSAGARMAGSGFKFNHSIEDIE